MRIFAKVILTICLITSCTISWANSPFDSYAELAFNFNASGAPEIEAEKVDQFLVQAKSFLKENKDSDSTEYKLVESMVQKIKVYQFLFNQFHGNMPTGDGRPEIYNELAYQALRGAFGANPKPRKLLIFEDDHNFDGQIKSLADITEGLTPTSFFIMGDPTDVKDFPSLIKKKIMFLQAMAKDSRKKNMIAKWSLDYSFKGREIDCQSVSEEFINQCEVTKILIERNPDLVPTSIEEVTDQINEHLTQARKYLSEELDPNQLFQLFRDKYDPMANIKMNELNLVVPKVTEKFPMHTMELQKILTVHGLKLLESHPKIHKELQWLTLPHLQRTCDINPFKRDAFNCGYKSRGKYGKSTVSLFSRKLLQEALNDTYQKIEDEESRLIDLEKRLENLLSEDYKTIPSYGSNRAWIKHYTEQKRVNKELNKKMIVEIERRPQSYGAALMEMNEFIPMASFQLISMVEEINTKQFYSNLKSVGVITALIASAFMTGPVGIAAGLAISVYEIIEYSSKTKDYKSKAAAATIDFIDAQTGGMLSDDELNFLGERINHLEEKVKKYRMYTYFAAAGLMSAPISFGMLLAKSSGKVQIMLENIKYLEKFAKLFGQSNKVQSKVIRIMHTLGIKDPTNFFMNLMQTRKHLMEIHGLTTAILIKNTHKLIKNPERIHLAERAFAGTDYFKKAIGNTAIANDILTTMGEIEYDNVNFFSE